MTDLWELLALVPILLIFGSPLAIAIVYIGSEIGQRLRDSSRAVRHAR